MSEPWGLNVASFSNAAAFSDLDNDGDLDYIVSNINEPAFLFENQLNNRDQKNKPSFLNIKFSGSAGNRNGIGTRVTIAAHGHLQYLENSVYRGFLSSVEPNLHFGLGNSTGVDSLLVVWPDGNTQVIKKPPINQTVVVDYKMALKRPLHWNYSNANRPLFKELESGETIGFKHVEEDIIDFNNQRTIPHKFSQGGPGIAVGDVDQDGLDDVVIGASAGHPLTLFKQLKSGSFSAPLSVGAPEKPQEDTGLLLFDADRDGDLDLFAVSGGAPFNQTPECYRHSDLSE